LSVNFRATKSSGTGWLANLCAQFLPFFAFFVAAPFLLSALGQTEFGLLMIFSLAPQIAGQLDLGLATAATRLIAKYGSEAKAGHARRVFFEAITGLGGLGLAYGILLLLFARPLANVLGLNSVFETPAVAWVAVVATMVWGIIGMLMTGVSLPFRAFQQYRLLAYVQAGGGVLFWSGAVVFAKAGLGVVQILWWGGATAAVGSGALLWFLRSWLAEPVTLPDDRLLLKVWRYGAGVFVSQASSLLTYHLDKLLVGALVSPAAAGIYAACSNMAAKLLAVIAVISTFSFPQAVALHTASDRPAIRQLFVRGSRVSMLLSLSFGVPAIVLSSNFVMLWLGNDAATKFGTGFALLIAGYVLSATSVVAANITSGMGDSRTPAIFSVIGGVTTLALCAVLAYRYGALGAAAGAVAGMSQSLIFCLLIGRRLGGKSLTALGKSLLFPALTSFVVGGCLFAVSHWAEGWFSLFGLGGGGVALILLSGLVEYSEGRVRWLGLRK